MTPEEVEKLLTPQEREAGFNLVYLPAMFYLLHGRYGILRGWYEMVDVDELADLIKDYIDRP